MAIPSVAQFQQLQKNIEQRQKTFNESRPVQREVDYFKSAVARLTSVDDLFKDTRLVKFIASAVNLDGEDRFMGRLKRILTESVDNEDAMMYRLSDKRFQQAAAKLRLGDDGLKNLKLAVTQDELIASYRKNEFEKSIGNQNVALREAMYFDQFAKDVTSVWDVLGDPILRKVVTKALGIPERFAIQPLETQAAAVTSRVDVTKFQDKDFRDKFLRRYLNQVDLENSQQGNGAGNWQTMLFSGNRGQSLNLFA